jgi:hypothetical protein
VDLDYLFHDKEEDVGDKTDICFAESLTLVEEDAAHQLGQTSATP